MEETIVTSGSKVLLEYGFLGVTVVVLAYFIRKMVNAVWLHVNSTIDRQREANIEKDKIILELSKRIAELESNKCEVKK